MEKEGYEAETAKRFNIDLHKLEAEQKKLAKSVSLRDSIDFSLVETAAACYNAFIDNTIISAFIVCNPSMEILDQQYSTRKLEFPYLSGFRAYRELPAMIGCYNKLAEAPDIIFVEGHGILHPRGLGIASHLGISIQKPTIGIAQKLLIGEASGEEVLIRGKAAGYAVSVRQGSKPFYVSPGHMISLKSALEVTKKFLRLPHKLPEPLVLARKFANRIREEIRVE